jgi:hypothetical protein
MAASKKALAAAMARSNGDGPGSDGSATKQTSDSPLTRTTIMYPVALDENLEVYSIQVGRAKGEIIKEVLSDFLRTKGLQPDKRPRRIEVSY